MDLAKVRELVKLVEESKIDELEITSKDTTIRIQKQAATIAAPVVMPPPASVPAAAAAPPTPTAETAAVQADPARVKWKEIRSPIVGTFYRAPAPDAEPFVEVGDTVQPGQTLCIIEAMKVMNEIEAEFPCVIKEILVGNGQPVEAEGPLFLVEPL